MNFADVTLASLSNGKWLIVSALLLGLIFLQLLKRNRLYRQLSPQTRYYEAFKGYSSWRLLVRWLLPCLGTWCLAVVLLRPQWGKVQEQVEQRGRHLFIALDVSRSMLAQDLKPSRLEYAKQKIKMLLSLLPSDMVGLILFAGDAFVHCPLTTDEQAFLMFLDNVDAHSISAGSTSVAGALKKALEAFSKSSAGTEMVVIFTDGEDFSEELSLIKEQAHQQKLIIFTTGIGTAAGAPIPILEPNGVVVGHQKNDQGGVVISRLHESLLQSLATDSGGFYVQSTPTNQDMRQIAQHVESFEKERFGDRNASYKKDRYHYWAGVAFICFLLEWMVG